MSSQEVGPKGEDLSQPNSKTSISGIPSPTLSTKSLVRVSKTTTTNHQLQGTASTSVNEAFNEALKVHPGSYTESMDQASLDLRTLSSTNFPTGRQSNAEEFRVNAVRPTVLEPNAVVQDKGSPSQHVGVLATPDEITYDTRQPTIGFDKETRLAIDKDLDSVTSRPSAQRQFNDPSVVDSSTLSDPFLPIYTSARQSLIDQLQISSVRSTFARSNSAPYHSFGRSAEVSVQLSSIRADPSDMSLVHEDEHVGDDEAQNRSPRTSSTVTTPRAGSGSLLHDMSYRTPTFKSTTRTGSPLRPTPSTANMAIQQITSRPYNGPRPGPKSSKPGQMAANLLREGPFFSYNIPHSITSCWLVTCNNPTVSRDCQTVTCPRCGDHSYVRYCSASHLISDLREHYISHCGRRQNLLAINEATMTPISNSFRPFIRVLHDDHDSLERHRQALYHAYPPEAAAGQPFAGYYIFNDIDDFEASNLPVTPANLYDFRGAGSVVARVYFYNRDPRKTIFTQLLERLLAFGVSAGSTDVSGCRLLFQWIKENLVHHNEWSEIMVTRLCLAMQLEFGWRVDLDMRDADS